MKQRNSEPDLTQSKYWTSFVLPFSDRKESSVGLDWNFWLNSCSEVHRDFAFCLICISNCHEFRSRAEGERETFILSTMSATHRHWFVKTSERSAFLSMFVWLSFVAFISFPCSCSGFPSQEAFFQSLKWLLVPLLLNCSLCANLFQVHLFFPSFWRFFDMSFSVLFLESSVHGPTYSKQAADLMHLFAVASDEWCVWDESSSKILRFSSFLLHHLRVLAICCHSFSFLFGCSSLFPSFISRIILCVKSAAMRCSRYSTSSCWYAQRCKQKRDREQRKRGMKSEIDCSCGCVALTAAWSIPYWLPTSASFRPSLHSTLSVCVCLSLSSSGGREGARRLSSADQGAYWRIWIRRRWWWKRRRKTVYRECGSKDEWC